MAEEALKKMGRVSRNEWIMMAVFIGYGGIVTLVNTVVFLTVGTAWMMLVL